jgi:transcriptional regulator with XRE-family HTH domain
MAWSLAKVIGMNLRRARARAGLTQEKLGKLSRVDAATLSRYENGRFAPRFSTLARLASTLKMLPEELAGTKPGAPAPALRPDQQALLKDYEALSPGYRRTARRLLRDLGRVRT